MSAGYRVRRLAVAAGTAGLLAGGVALGGAAQAVAAPRATVAASVTHTQDHGKKCVWERGHWDKRWVKGHWEKKWVRGGERDHDWKDGHDGNRDRNGGWHDSRSRQGHGKWVYVPGHWEKEWVKGHWDCSYKDRW
ncbi:hypothetical protein [Streptomyces sp. cmx-4-9]|uniref:hypothetical protein n=1 Tax=Streptomyces sp. cmx-4-9 TaxID=2790941 RepID=UPI00397F743B